jgi:hypothetical protein
LYENSTWRVRFAKSKDKTTFLWGTPELAGQGDGKEHKLRWKVFKSPTDKTIHKMAAAGKAENLDLDPGSMCDGCPQVSFWQGRILRDWMAHFGSVRSMKEYKALGPYDPSNPPKKVFQTQTASENEQSSEPTEPPSNGFDDPASHTKVRVNQGVLGVLMFGTRRLTRTEISEAARTIKKAFRLKETPDRNMMLRIIKRKTVMKITGIKVFAFNAFKRWMESVKIDKTRIKKGRKTPRDTST